MYIVSFKKICLYVQARKLNNKTDLMLVLITSAVGYEYALSLAWMSNLDFLQNLYLFIYLFYIYLFYKKCMYMCMLMFPST